MSKIWKTIPVFFCVMLFLCTSIPVQAAGLQVQWYNGETETDISVEKGQKFYLGDFISIIEKNTSKTAALSKASYRSGSSKTASINGKGYLNAKKVGKTDITVTCMGTRLVCHLTVEKKGTFDSSAAVKNLQAAGKKFPKNFPKKLNASKAFALKKKIDAFLVEYQSYSAKKLAYDGFLYEKERPAPDNNDYKRCEKLAAPLAGRYLSAEALLRQFILDNDPTSIQSKKTMKIVSAAASSKTGKITIKLSKSLNADQICAAQLAFPEENGTINSRSKANIRVSVYDETTEKYYTALIPLKKGSRQYTTNLSVYTYGKYENVDIVKGHTYLIGSKLIWAGGTRIKAK